MSELLKARDVSVHLAGKPVVEKVSFSLEAGESLALIGPNGAGKTVLLRALLKLVPYTGTITWAPKTNIGYVPQKIDADRNLPVHFGNLFKAKAALRGIAETEIHAVIDTVGLSETILKTPVGKLSGGQFQRALLAFALLGSPRVLLLDEPTANLDEPGQERTYELLERLRQTYGISLVLVSHDLSLVYGFARRVLCLNRSAVCLGPPQEVLTPAAMEQLFGGPTKFYHTNHQHSGPDHVQ